MCYLKGVENETGKEKKCNVTSNHSERDKETETLKTGLFERAQRAMGASGKQLVWIQERKRRGERVPGE